MSRLDRILQLAKLIGVALSPLPRMPQGKDRTQLVLSWLEEIARKLQLIQPLPSQMATVTFSVGTSSRDYSTWTSAEADGDNGGLYSSGDDPLWEGYDDSVFNEGLTINCGATVGLNSITMRPAAGEGHDGTAGTGVRFVQTGYNRIDISTDIPTHFLGIEVDCASNNGIAINSDTVHEVGRCIVHDDAGGGRDGISGSYRPCVIHNNVIYDMSGSGINFGAGDANGQKINNNTVYNCTGTGIVYADFNSIDSIRNNVCMGNGTDFSKSSPTNATASNNISSDATAPGTSSLTNQTTADQFEAITGGSEDLKLKTGADAIGAGADLGTSPAGVQYDILGRDRDSSGDTWDVGAHQTFSAVASAVIPIGLFIHGVLR